MSCPNLRQMPGHKIIKVNLSILLLMLILSGCYRLQVGAQRGLATTYHPIQTGGVEFGLVTDYYVALVDNDPTQGSSFLLSPHYKSHKDSIVEYNQTGVDFGYQYNQGSGTSQVLVAVAAQVGRATVEPETYTAPRYREDDDTFVTERQTVTTYGAYYKFSSIGSVMGLSATAGFARVPLEGEYTTDTGTTITTKYIDQIYLGLGVNYTF
jgi:hypothetical protein